MRPIRWYLHTRIAGLVVFAVGMLIVGLGVARGVASAPVQTRSLTRTLHHTTTQVKLVTVRVRGKVIRRHDHILVVLVPRTVFHTRTTPSRRIVVPRHVVRIRQPLPVFGETEAVIGVAPPPQTVTVTEQVPVPGPTTTVTDTTTTTTTEPGTTVTVTVTLPIPPEGTP